MTIEQLRRAAYMLGLAVLLIICVKFLGGAGMLMALIGGFVLIALGFLGKDAPFPNPFKKPWDQ